MKKLERMFGVAKAASEIVIKNGKSFYDKTVEEVKSRIKSDKEKIEDLNSILKDDKLTDKEVLSKIRSVLGGSVVEKKATEYKDSSIDRVSDNVYILTSDVKLKEKIMNYHSHDKDDILEEIDKDSKNIIRDIENLRQKINNNF